MEKSIEPSSQAAFRTGRRVGILLLLQLAAALTLPFILSKPITLGTPAFLTEVAAHFVQIRTAVLLSFIGAALTVYLGIAVYQQFRHYSKPVALLFLVVCAVSGTLDLVHAGTIMSMLSLSNAFVASGAKNPELYEVVGAAVASARRSAHSTQLLAIGAWMFVFYVSLVRFRLIPWILAVTGVVGVLLQFTGVTLMMLLGYRSIGEMAMPMLPIQITVAIWLISKGFTDRTQMPTVLSQEQS